MPTLFPCMRMQEWRGNSMLARIRNRIALLDTTQSVPLKLQEPVASFTFDDFPISAYAVAGKMLEDAGARGTYFASAEFMGRSIEGIDYYTPELLKEVYGKGHEIGCHSFSHVHLGSKGTAFARDSADKNLAVMRAVLGESFMMTSFAYPYGDVSPAVKWTMGRRFALCRGVHQEENSGAVDLAQIRIISLESRHWNPQALERVILQAKCNGSWLVFLTHDISDTPTPYGSTPAMMQTALGLLAQSAVPIMPLKAAAAKAIFGG